MALALSLPPKGGCAQWLACGKPTYGVQAQMSGPDSAGVHAVLGNHQGDWVLGFHYCSLPFPRPVSSW